MTLEEMNIPASIKMEAADLIRRIDLADGLLELSTLGGMAEGFMIGVPASRRCAYPTQTPWKSCSARLLIESWRGGLECGRPAQYCLQGHPRVLY
jgi:hypothetical protein